MVHSHVAAARVNESTSQERVITHNHSATLRRKRRLDADCGPNLFLIDTLCEILWRNIRGLIFMDIAPTFEENVTGKYQRLWKRDATGTQ